MWDFRKGYGFVGDQNLGGVEGDSNTGFRWFDSHIAIFLWNRSGIVSTEELDKGPSVETMRRLVFNNSTSHGYSDSLLDSSAGTPTYLSL